MNKREEAIERWKSICSTVFWAEDNISKEWYPKLKEAHSLDKEKQFEITEEYCRAIAREIVSHTTDEELERWF